ncbi:carboxypeptidase-like regulatory domain-containing protein [Maribacter sp. 4G9]|uniref:carboxypeptidase-like regulatory domain-containing protein n=1 Tax=Maribacter sp. 4G9 TaxID=1889777 RepID=UPI000C15524E
MKKKINPNKIKSGVNLKISLFFIFMIMSNGAFSQTDGFKEFLGEVYDSDTKKPLIFATLTLEGTNISTITNTEGEFSLKVPESNTSENVIVSFLGYKTKQIPILQFKSDGNEISMTELVTQLAEVNLSVPKDARALVRETLKKRGENYIDNPTVMTAFYRETIKRRRQNVSLSEAVVNIYKAPYSSNKNDALKLFKARKSTDYSKLDTLALKLQGGPFNALFVDMVKYPDYIFADDLFEFYDFSFSNATRVDDKQIYVINFEQKPSVLDPLYSGKLYIDVDNKILTSAIYSLNITDRDLAAQMFVRRKPRNADVWPTEVAYRVDYREKDGKWYYGYSNVMMEFKINWDKKLFNSVYSMSCEMAITDWEENLSNEIPKYRDRIKSDIILTDEAIGFADPDFWGEYNIIEPEKSIESAIKKIQRQLKRGKIDGGGASAASQ